MKRSLFVLMFGVLIGCNNKPTPDDRVIEADGADIARAVDGNTAFAFDLYAKLRKQSGNLFFSPYSVSTAFAMTSAGARNDTSKEMVKVFHFDLDPDKFHPTYEALTAKIQRNPVGYDLRVANALWGQKDFGFKQPFIELVKKHYGAGLREVDFHQAKAASDAINAWVAEQTKNTIPSLVDPSDFNELTRLVLANAIYMKGQWASSFKKDDTMESFFYLEPGKPIRVPMMGQCNEFDYLEEATFQAVRLPYEGKKLSMMILLPVKADGLPAFEEMLTPANLNLWAGKLKETRINLYLPRFTMAQSLNLGDTLSSMGMPSAFQDGKADFTGMTGPNPSEPLHISKVVHKAFISVNEEGTEASGATAVILEKKDDSPRIKPKVPPEFRANRPFFFVIRDNSTGSILFMGRVMEPKE